MIDIGNLGAAADGEHRDEKKKNRRQGFSHPGGHPAHRQSMSAGKSEGNISE